jgi:hypothetical protein
MSSWWLARRFLDGTRKLRQERLCWLTQKMPGKAFLNLILEGQRDRDVVWSKEETGRKALRLGLAQHKWRGIRQRLGLASGIAPASRSSLVLCYTKNAQRRHSAARHSLSRARSPMGVSVDERAGHEKLNISQKPSCSGKVHTGPRSQEGAIRVACKIVLVKKLGGTRRTANCCFPDRTAY